MADALGAGTDLGVASAQVASATANPNAFIHVTGDWPVTLLAHLDFQCPPWYLIPNLFQLDFRMRMDARA